MKFINRVKGSLEHKKCPKRTERSKN